MDTMEKLSPLLDHEQHHHRSGPGDERHTYQNDINDSGADATGMSASLDVELTNDCIDESTDNELAALQAALMVKYPDVQMLSWHHRTVQSLVWDVLDLQMALSATTAIQDEQQQKVIELEGLLAREKNEKKGLVTDFRNALSRITMDTGDSGSSNESSEQTFQPLSTQPSITTTLFATSEIYSVLESDGVTEPFPSFDILVEHEDAFTTQSSDGVLSQEVFALVAEAHNRWKSIGSFGAPYLETAMPSVQCISQRLVKQISYYPPGNGVSDYNHACYQCTKNFRPCVRFRLGDTAPILLSLAPSLRPAGALSSELQFYAREEGWKFPAELRVSWNQKVKGRDPEARGSRKYKVVKKPEYERESERLAKRVRLYMEEDEEGKESKAPEGDGSFDASTMSII